MQTMTGGVVGFAKYSNIATERVHTKVVTGRVHADGSTLRINTPPFRSGRGGKHAITVGGKSLSFYASAIVVVCDLVLPVHPERSRCRRVAQDRGPRWI